MRAIAPAMMSVWGGEAVFIGGALLFLWFAISGSKPKPRLEGEKEVWKPISTPERIAWAGVAAIMIAYEVRKFRLLLKLLHGAH